MLEVAREVEDLNPEAWLPITLLPRQGEPSHNPIEPSRAVGKSLHPKVKVHRRVQQLSNLSPQSPHSKTAPFGALFIPPHLEHLRVEFRGSRGSPTLAL
jgi:hypothetical protein